METTTIKDNANLLSSVEQALMAEIIGNPKNGEMTDWENVVLIKKYADENNSKSAQYLFDKLVENTQYGYVKATLIDDNLKLTAEINKAYIYEYERFMLILTAMAYKYKRFMEINVLHKNLSPNVIKEYAKAIVSSLGSKDLLTIVLFCTDELNDKAIEYYMKDL